MANQKRKRSGGAHKRGEGIPADAMVNLTPQGRAMYEQFLALASQEAGRPITGEELLAALRATRQELGSDDPDFTRAENVECFRRRLRAIGGR